MPEQQRMSERASEGANERAGPVALITGAGSGIGRATAVMLAEAGWRLGLVGRSRERLEASAGLCRKRGAGATIAVRTADLADLEGAKGIIEWVESTFGRLDALVNNAGVGELVAIAETTPELLQRTFAVNAFAPAMLMAHAWRLFERQSGKEAGGIGPSIVNVSSMAASDPFPGLFAYAASKAALESYTRSIANEAGSLRIRAYAVAPGAVETPLLRSIFDEGVIPSNRTMIPEEVAQVIVDCILGRSDSETGATIRIVSR